MTARIEAVTEALLPAPAFGRGQHMLDRAGPRPDADPSFAVSAEQLQRFVNAGDSDRALSAPYADPSARLNLRHDD